ncbi:acetyltransferase [Sphingomonas gellani]|uniref:Acetyltransferase n=1 Tax=Sphingomonas gellani TaxID=1166340 RepID=A0A1H8C859_9SPHN|nr:bifunctional acetyl coenzyme A synthetase (ADP forming), alpha domain/GNAT family N-acetyltransferase [Sphingomonas gellani]SEM91220.1 acetyltransferase [Sphingomonas gellani]
MALRNLPTLLHPASIAVIGASRRQGTVGRTVLDNIVAGGFRGRVSAVNPHPLDVAGVECVASVDALRDPPELAVVALPAPLVPDALRRLGARGTRDAVVLSNGFAGADGREALLSAVAGSGMRIVGPNSLGVLIPRIGLNASFAPRAAAPGRLALLSQSGALVTAMLDWAADRQVGFSGVVSMGDMVDADAADLLDLFAADSTTDAILLQVESIRDAARFMSAARAAARLKPVIALRAGRSADTDGQGAFAADRVYRAAFRRAGMILVDGVAELFDAAQLLGCHPPRCGSRVAIVTNGGGAGRLAADALAASGGTLAQRAGAEPVEVVADRGHAERVGAAVAAALADAAVDAVLTVHCPTAFDDGQAAAQAVVAAATGARKPVIACWMGPATAAAVRPMFAAARLALFDNVDDAVRGLSHLRQAAEGREALLRAPPALSIPDHDRERARAIIVGARLEGPTELTGTEARFVAAAYGIPIVASHLARTTAAVAEACAALPGPYVVKICSPDLPNKAAVGGVALALPDAGAAVAAAQEMRRNIGDMHPDADLIGFEVASMVGGKDVPELRVRVVEDAVFGPVIGLGVGGTLGAAFPAMALDLPPLDDALAQGLVARAGIAALIAAPGAEATVVRVLNAVAALAADLPELESLDIDPLVVAGDRLTALDVRMHIAARPREGRLAIRPVPAEWTADLTTRSGLSIHVHPVRPDDVGRLADLFHHVTPEDLRFRFLSGVREVGRDRLVAMTQIDYRRTINFLAFADEVPVATAMLACDPDRSRGELAVSVRGDFKGRGISWSMVQHVLRYAKAEGIETIEAVESRDNHAALALEREMGFETVEDAMGERVVRRSVAD